MKAIDRLALGMVVLVGITGCSNSKDPSAPLSLSAALDDPVGDTYATSEPAGTVIPDLVRLAASLEDTVLVVRFEFADVMVSDAVGGANVVAGFLDIDIDQNGATGMTAATDVFRPAGSGSTGMEDEYFVSLWADSQGRYEIRRASDGAVTGTVNPLFHDKTLELRLPLSTLGPDDGHANLAAVVGTMSGPTDIAPNTGHLALGAPAAVAARVQATVIPALVSGRTIRWGR